MERIWHLETKKTLGEFRLSSSLKRWGSEDDMGDAIVDIGSATVSHLLISVLRHRSNVHPLHQLQHIRDHQGTIDAEVLVLVWQQMARTPPRTMAILLITVDLHRLHEEM
jgi:hypothetical protein